MILNQNKREKKLKYTPVNLLFNVYSGVFQAVHYTHFCYGNVRSVHALLIFNNNNNTHKRNISCDKMIY